MANQSWVSLLNPASPQASGAGTSLTGTSAQTLSPLTGAAAISDVAQVQPASQPYGWYPGLLLRVTAQGFVTTTGTSCTMTLSLGSRVGNSGSTIVTLATTAAIGTGTGSLTGLPWSFLGFIRCTAIATTGNTVATMGQFELTHNTTAPLIGSTTAGVDLSAFMPATSGETAAAVDTTQLQGISFQGILSAAHATVQLSQWLVEALD